MNKGVINNLNNLLICPNCHKENLKISDENILCDYCKETYPIIYGIPVLITKKRCQELNLDYYSENYLQNILKTENFKKNKYDVYNYIKTVLIGTNGILYKNINEPEKYPIANVPFLKNENLNKPLFIDIGCGWGRWVIDAANKGYNTIGVDITLINLIISKKILEKYQIDDCNFICCDVLNLPISDNSIDIIHSFSFLQHFSEENLNIILSSIHRIMKENAIFKTQMVNKYSLRGIYNFYKFKNSKKSLHKGKIYFAQSDFDVRYFNIKKLNQIFSKLFKINKIENYSFFTQAQFSDFKLFKFKAKIYLIIVNVINLIAKILPFLKNISDNLLFTLSKK